MQNSHLSDLEIAEKMADAARAAILPFFRQTNLETSNKLQSGYDPVTVADREAEQAMRAVLAEFRPDDGVLGEEFGTSKGASGRTWVLDPIDGTRGFVSGTPTWGVLIALGQGKGPMLGVIDQPYIGERFIGSPDGAFMTAPWAGPLLKRARPVALIRRSCSPLSPRLEPKQKRALFKPLRTR